MKYKDEMPLKSMSIQFQGGFVGTGFHVYAGPDSKNLELAQEFYPEDINSMQHFVFDQTKLAKCFKFVFNGSTDFFGRIIIYKLTPEMC